MKKSKPILKKSEKLLGTEQEGVLVAHFGATAEVEDNRGNIIRCHLRKNAEQVVTGDRVLWRPEDSESGLIVNYFPRKSLLIRSEKRNKIKPLASNIDAIIIVIAPPYFSDHLVDRYLVAAANLSIPPLILVNKKDLLNESTFLEANQFLENYRTIGYQTLISCAIRKDGLNDLSNFLKDKTCVLVGPSGVGKSSIIASFLPDHAIRTKETSEQGLGKHTTTMTRLYHLPNKGNLIDSPGIRDFGIWHMDKDAILEGFLEFKPFLNQCKFRNCHHDKEVGCAIKNAVEEGKITTRRFESYKEMVAALAG